MEIQCSYEILQLIRIYVLQKHNKALYDFFLKFYFSSSLAFLDRHYFLLKNMAVSGKNCASKVRVG